MDGQKVGMLTMKLLASIEKHYGEDAEIEEAILVVAARAPIEEDGERIVGTFVDCTNPRDYIKLGLLHEGRLNIEGRGEEIAPPDDPT